jgi:hypothetical protein
MSDARREDDLQAIPGIGPSLERALNELGYTVTSDLAQEDPESMYRRLCEARGGHVDRCVLYAFRCAVYFASHRDHDPRLLMWWQWKDTSTSA